MRRWTACVLQVGIPVTISPPALALLLAPGEHTHTHTCAHYPVRVCAHIHRLTENSVVYLSINVCVYVCVPGVCVFQGGWGQSAALIIMNVWTITVRTELSASTIWMVTAAPVHKDSGTRDTGSTGDTRLHI